MEALAQPRQVRRIEIWLALAVSINLLAFGLTRAPHKSAVEFGAAFDVAITVPALYYLLVLRSKTQHWFTMIPLCLLAMLRATYVAPAFAPLRPALGASAELVVGGFLFWRVRRGLRAAGAGDDILDRLRAAAREIVPLPRLAEVLAYEMAVFWYAFASWRRRPEVPEGYRAFSIHQQSGIAMLFGVLAGVSVLEGAGVHLLVSRWNVRIAWLLSALTAYGFLWLLAMARAFVLRPVLLNEDELIVRSGLMWNLRVPLAQIVSVHRGAGEADLRLPPASEPNIIIELAEALPAQGMYGKSRQVQRVGLMLDAPSEFSPALR